MNFVIWNYKKTKNFSLIKKKKLKKKKIGKKNKLHDVKIAINSNIVKFHDKTPYLILMHSLGGWMFFCIVCFFSISIRLF